MKIFSREFQVEAAGNYKLEEPASELAEILKIASENLSSSSELEVLDIVERIAADCKMRNLLEQIWSRKDEIEKNI